MNASFVKSAATWDDLPSDGIPEAVFIGRSNVGKSSLLNRLTGEKNLAFTSKKPGRTRTFNVYRVERASGGRSGGPAHFLDAPGVGYAKAPKDERERWQRLLGHYLLEREPLRAVLHLIDSRHPPQPLDGEVIQLLGGQRVPYLAVLTKADALKQGEGAKAMRHLREVLAGAGLEAPVLLTSAHTGAGCRDLRAWLGDLL